MRFKGAWILNCMHRFIALLLSAGVGSVAAWQVYVNLDQIVSKWLITIGFTTGTFLVVTMALYFPLFRHIADEIEAQLSTINSRFTARKTGIGFEEVPQHASRRKTTTMSNRALCSLCGGPGGPICETCADKMSKK